MTWNLEIFLTSKRYRTIFFGWIFSVLMAGFIPAAGQDQTNFTQFFLNPYQINASYAGIDGQPAISLIYRRQWMTIDGAPTITNLSLHAPVTNRLSAGVNVTNESTGFFKNTALLFSAAYHVAFGDHTFLRFGLSAGGSWNTVDMQKLDGVNDPALSGVLDNNASLAGNAGVSIHHKSFHAGIAMPALFSPAYVSEDAFTVTEIKPFQALIFHASNRFYFNNDKNIFEPYAIYRFNTGLHPQFELAGIVHLNHVLWAGASFKEDFGISALGGIKLKNALAIGASYSIQKSGVEELNSPSFEVSLNYLFGAKKRGAPVYSFVNAVKVKERAQSGVAAKKKQDEENKKKAEAAAKLKQEQEDKRRLAAESAKQKQAQAQADAKAKAEQQAAAKKQLEEQQVARQQQAAQERAATEQARLAEQNSLAAEAKAREDESRTRLEQEAMEKANAEAREREETQARQQQLLQQEQARAQAETLKQKQIDDDARAAEKAVAPSAEITEGHPAHEQEQLQRLAEHAANPTELHVDTTRTSSTVRHETVKRGSHPEELEASEYVIAGVFKSTANARHFSNGLRNLNFNSRVGYLTEKDLWYVYIFRSADAQQAEAEQKRVGKLFLLRDAWRLTVVREGRE